MTLALYGSRSVLRMGTPCRASAGLCQDRVIGVNSLLSADLLLKTLLSCPGPIAGDVELQDGRVVDDPCQWQLQAVAIPEPVARVAAGRHQVLTRE